MALLRERRGQLSADFRRYYACNLRDALAGEVASLRDISDWAANLPYESATYRAENPEWAHDWKLEFLRAIDYDLQLIQWQNANQGLAKGQNPSRQPDPFRFPWEAERDSEQRNLKGRKTEPLPADQAADLLGGDPRMVAAFERAFATVDAA